MASSSIDELRSKGITIETPESRKLEANLVTRLTQLSTDDADVKKFQYILIPADESKEITQIEGLVPNEVYGKVDILKYLLKPKFSGSSGDQIDVESLKKSASNTLLSNQQSAGFNGKQVSIDSLTETALQNSEKEGAVEVFKLSEHESFYLDEIGSFKNLQRNKRASYLASFCGFGKDIPFFGEIYLGRLRETGGKLFNVDIKLSEVDLKNISSFKHWCDKGREYNLRVQRVREEHGVAAGQDVDEINTKGGETKVYQWSQTTEEVEIVLKETIIKAKHVKVTFKKRSLQVWILGEIVIDIDTLFANTVSFENTWSLVDGKLVITLLKEKQGQVWNSVE